MLPPEICAPGGQGLAHASQPAGHVTMVSQFGTAPPVGEPIGALVTMYVGCCVGVMPAPTDSWYVVGVWYCIVALACPWTLFWLVGC